MKETEVENIMKSEVVDWEVMKKKSAMSEQNTRVALDIFLDSRLNLFDSTFPAP